MRFNTRRLLPQLLLALLLVAVVAIGLVGLSFRANGEPTSTSSQPRAVLRWANEGVTDLFSLEPAQGPDFNTRMASQLIFGGLVRFGPGFKILPDGASRWTVSRDGRTY